MRSKHYTERTQPAGVCVCVSNVRGIQGRLSLISKIRAYGDRGRLDINILLGLTTNLTSELRDLWCTQQLFHKQSQRHHY